MAQASTKFSVVIENLCTVDYLKNPLVTDCNRLQSVTVSFLKFFFFFYYEKTATRINLCELKPGLAVVRKLFAVQLHDQFFPVAATGLQNTSYQCGGGETLDPVVKH